MSERAARPLLTVGIPTWNRSQYVSEAVDSLAAEIVRHSLEGEVEIFVSDNGSDDDTRAVVAERAARHPFVRYVRNERNMGVKFNVLQVLRLAEGRYSMMLGDDDRLVEDSLPAIVGRLREQAPPALFVQHAGHNYVFRDVEEDTLLGVNEIGRRYFYQIGNAGVFILDAESARRVIEERGYEFFCSNWPQTQVICLSIARQGRPALFSPIRAVNSGLHESLSVYSSHYFWELRFAELYEAARDLRPFLGDEFWAEVSERLCAEMETYVNDMIFYASLVDTREQRRRTAASIRRMLPSLPWRVWPKSLLLWLHAGLPRSVVAPFYRARIRLMYGPSVIRDADERMRKQVEKRALATSARAVRENIW